VGRRLKLEKLFYRYLNGEYLTVNDLFYIKL